MGKSHPSAPDSVPTPSVRPPGVVPESPRLGELPAPTPVTPALSDRWRSTDRACAPLAYLSAARRIASGSPCRPLPIPFRLPPSGLRESSRNLRVLGEPPAPALVAPSLSGRWRPTARACAPLALIFPQPGESPPVLPVGRSRFRSASLRRASGSRPGISASGENLRLLLPSLRLCLVAGAPQTEPALRSH